MTKNKRQKILKPVQLSLIISIAAVFISIWVINSLMPPKTFQSIDDKINHSLRIEDYYGAEKAYKHKLNYKPYDIDANYGYISIFHKANKEYNDNRGNLSVFNFYKNLRKESEPQSIDIGNLGMAMCHIENNYADRALNSLNKISDKTLKYTNLIRAKAYYKLQNYDSTHYFFEKELKLYPLSSESYYHYAYMLFNLNNHDKLDALIKSSDIAENSISSYVKRMHFYQDLQILNYIKEVYRYSYQNLYVLGLISAFLVMLCWLFYLRKIDVFEPESWGHIAFAFLSGMFFTQFVFPLSDFLDNYFWFGITGNPGNDFMYCFIGIGMVEELVKFIPLLLIMRFTKAINEPVDYIIYASVSALGFAFVENLSYYSVESLYSIHGRALMSVVLHMFMSSIIAYAYVINKRNPARKPALKVFYYFILAALAHGFYDFWLISPSANGAHIISYIFMIICLSIYNRFITNALNLSPFFDINITLNRQKLQSYLIYSLIGVLLLQLFIVAFVYGPGYVNEGLESTLFQGSYLLLFITLRLGKFKLKQNHWNSMGINLDIPQITISFDPDEILSTKVHLKTFTRSPLMNKYLPNLGVVESRKEMSNYKNWYIIKLENPAITNKLCATHVLVKAKDKEKPIIPGQSMFVALCAIKNFEVTRFPYLNRNNFAFLGWAVLSSEPKHNYENIVASS